MNPSSTATGGPAAATNGPNPGTTPGGPGTTADGSPNTRRRDRSWADRLSWVMIPLMLLLLGFTIATLALQARTRHQVRDLHRVYYPHEGLYWYWDNIHKAYYPHDDLPDWITVKDGNGKLYSVNVKPYFRFGKNVTVRNSYGTVYYVDPDSYMRSRHAMTVYDSHGNVYFAVPDLTDWKLTVYDSRGNVYYKDSDWDVDFTIYANDDVYEVDYSSDELDVDDSQGNGFKYNFIRNELAVYSSEGNIFFANLGRPFRAVQNKTSHTLVNFIQPSWFPYLFWTSNLFKPKSAKHSIHRNMTRRGLDSNVDLEVIPDGGPDGNSTSGDLVEVDISRRDEGSFTRCQTRFPTTCTAGLPPNYDVVAKPWPKIVADYVCYAENAFGATYYFSPSSFVRPCWMASDHVRVPLAASGYRCQRDMGPGQVNCCLMSSLMHCCDYAQKTPGFEALGLECPAIKTENGLLVNKTFTA